MDKNKKAVKDIDDALKASSDKTKAAAALKERAKSVLSERQENIGQGPKLPDLSFKSFEVLGEDQEGNLLFWSKANRKVYCHDLKGLQYDQLIQMGGDEISGKVGRGKRYDQVGMDGSLLWPFPAVKEIMIKEAAKRQLGNLRYLGQGIHRLGDGKLLIVNGGEAALWDGKRFSEHNHPMIDGKIIEWSPGRSWCDLSRIRQKVISMKAVDAASIADRLFEIVNQWGFAEPNEAFLFTGWALGQHIQDLWDWRPHLWLTGAAGSGKTILISLLEGLAGDLALRREGKSLTEAGLRQDMSNDKVFCLLDEFEKSEAREAIIEYLRSASRGGLVVKGTTAQKAVHFFVRHMALLASIEYRLARAAERSRFLVIELKKDDSRHPTIPNVQELENFRHEITAYCLWAAFPALRMVRDIERIPGFEDRLVESYAAPLSMLAVCKPDAAKILTNMVIAFLRKVQKTEEADAVTDEDRLLLDIGFAKIRLSVERQVDDRTAMVSQELTVSQILERIVGGNREDDDLHEVLQAHGLKVVDGNLFVVPEVAARKLLKDTSWAGLNIEPILRRIPDARKTRLRIAANQCYGVSLPYKMVTL